MRRYTPSQWVGLFLAACTGWLLADLLPITAHAEPLAEEHYRKLGAAPTTYRGGALDGGDSTAYASPLDTTGTIGTATSIQETNGNPNLIVSPRFSASGATAVITCALYYEAGGTYTFLGLAGVQTATASTTHLDGAAYIASDPLYFDLAGAHFYELRSADPSSGTVILTDRWTFGSQTQ